MKKNIKFATGLKKAAALAAAGTLMTGLLAGCGSSAGSTTEAASKSASAASASASEAGSSVSEDAADASSSESTAAAADSTEDTEEVTVRLGMLTSHALPVIALNHGYFEEEGVNVELVAFNTGAPEIEAFTAGELDIVETGDLPFFNAILNGVDIKAIGSYNTSDEINGLVVRDEANIQSFEDLAGKKVSVPAGTNIQPLLYEYLEAGGLTGEDVEIFNLAGNDAVNALINGDIDAAVLWEPYVSIAANTDGITKLADTKDFRTFVCPISSSSTFIEEHNSETLKVLRALSKAADWIADNEQAAAEEVVEYYGLDDIDAVLIGLEKADESIPLTDEKIDAIKLGAEKSYQYGVIAEEIDVDQYIDNQFTDKIKD